MTDWRNMPKIGDKVKIKIEAMDYFKLCQANYRYNDYEDKHYLGKEAILESIEDDDFLILRYPNGDWIKIHADYVEKVKSWLCRFNDDYPSIFQMIVESALGIAIIIIVAVLIKR
jgi:hypothetical protein